MGRLLILMLLGMPCGLALAQEDPFDLTATQEQVEELGIPSATKVEALGKEATSLFEGEECSAALPKLEAYARQANFLGNIISAGIEPYYDASHDDRKGVGGVYASVLNLDRARDVASGEPPGAAAVPVADAGADRRAVSGSAGR